MPTCSLCGNPAERPLTISIEHAGDTVTEVFDSFECAIAMLAPTCTQCGCRIVGHGLTIDDMTYCCIHCARSAGATLSTNHLLAAEGQGTRKIFQ